MWNARSTSAVSSPRSSSSPCASTSLCRVSTSAAVLCAAASPAHTGSIACRATSRSSGLCSPDSAARARSAAAFDAPASATNVPLPVRTSRTPAYSSERIASRTEPRLTPNRSARLRSGGSTVPGPNAPLRIPSRIWSTIASDSLLRPTVRSSKLIGLVHLPCPAPARLWHRRSGFIRLGRAGRLARGHGGQAVPQPADHHVFHAPLDGALQHEAALVEQHPVPRLRRPYLGDQQHQPVMRILGV